MKTSAVIISLLLILGSCTTDEKANLVYSDETETYRVKISIIETKINAKGKAQCSNHVRSIKSDSIYEYYGLDLPTQLAYSLETSKKYLTGSDLEPLGTNYLKVRIENLSLEPLNYDSILHVGLTACFNLDITPISKEIDGYQLEISDANKLNHNRVGCETGTTKYNKGIFSATSARLSGISRIIDANMEEYFDYNTVHDQCYNVEFIVNRDINKINNKLEEYGLRYEKANYDQVFYEIKVAANN